MPSSQCPQDVYARLMIPVDSSRGYPLWYPEPDSNLPEDYRDEGLRIGDVGIVTEDGSFDVLFNICLPEEHELHQRHGVPTTFEQVQISPQHIRHFPSADRAGRVISTQSVRDRNITAGVSGGNLALVPSPAIGFTFGFTSSSTKGAMLILPEGAGKEDLANQTTFMKEAQEKGESWYHFAYHDCGRTAINNDSLYLITGFHKASSWSVAAFSNAGGSAGITGTFTAGEVAAGSIAGAYSWQVSNSVHWRVGPEEGHSANRRNQAVSIRGYKIALRVFPLLRGPVKVSSRLPSTKFSTSHAYLPRPISSGNRAQCSEGSQGQLPQGKSSYEKGLPTSDNEFIGDNSEADDDTDTESYNVSIHPSPSPSKVYHPSDVINRFLLDSMPLANVAVTHDSEWMGMFKEDFPVGGDSDELIRQIHYSFHVEYDSTSGSVYLRERVHNTQNPMDINEYLDAHARALDMKYYVCRWIDNGVQCNVPTLGKDYATHVRTVHGVGGNPRAECKWKNCGEIFNKDGLARHLQEVHLQYRWPCPSCSEQFARKNTIIIHLTRCANTR